MTHMNLDAWKLANEIKDLPLSSTELMEQNIGISLSKLSAALVAKGLAGSHQSPLAKHEEGDAKANEYRYDEELEPLFYDDLVVQSTTK